MMAVSPRMRNALTLFSAVDDVVCHRVRLVLAAKGVTYDFIPVDPQEVKRLFQWGLIGKNSVQYGKFYDWLAGGGVFHKTPLNCSCQNLQEMQNPGWLRVVG